MEQQNARIVATALHAPDRVVPNAWFDAHLGEDVSTWLEENLTIRERRWCADDESTADLVTAYAGFVTALDMGASDFNRYCYAVAENVEAMLDGPVLDRLGEIRQPTLVLAGENDNLIPNRFLHGGHTRDVFTPGVAAMPDAELVMFAKCGHFVQFEKADETNAAVKGFLGR